MMNFWWNSHHRTEFKKDGMERLRVKRFARYKFFLLVRDIWLLTLCVVGRRGVAKPFHTLNSLTKYPLTLIAWRAYPYKMSQSNPFNISKHFFLTSNKQHQNIYALHHPAQDKHIKNGNTMTSLQAYHIIHVNFDSPKTFFLNHICFCSISTSLIIHAPNCHNTQSKSLQH